MCLGVETMPPLLLIGSHILLNILGFKGPRVTKLKVGWGDYTSSPCQAVEDTTPRPIYTVVETTPSLILIGPQILLNMSGFKWSKAAKPSVCGGALQVLASPWQKPCLLDSDWSADFTLSLSLKGPQLRVDASSPSECTIETKESKLPVM